MKKTLLILGILFTAMASAFAADEQPGANLNEGSLSLRPFSRYMITCPSIIENVNTGDRSNLRFFYTDGEPFAYKKRSANTLLIKTFNTSSSYFELFTHDGNSTSVSYNIKNTNKKTSAIAGLCTISF